MKILTSLFVSFLFCSAQHKPTLIDAYQQGFAGGHPMSGSGTKHHFIMKINTASPFVIKHLWVNGKEVEFEVMNYRMILDRLPTMGDTIDIVYTQRSNDFETITNIKKNGKGVPIKNAKNVIGYSINKKMFYLKVNTIRVAEKLNFP
jgi:hypothetical protein